ncbi:hypothetical protein QRD86_00105 (plasmid) [Bacillus halotolerans]|uniref:hypothetical protein n=1 Tax=Bacillus halotolerans TaxID=260554 RepID=UPI0025700EF0|nr:hypothetical protein [Bacillus halotolerans]WJE41190.1 hypothetical protein QRD86_00105 [Bacillus halotolerans]
MEKIIEEIKEMEQIFSAIKEELNEITVHTLRSVLTNEKYKLESLNSIRLALHEKLEEELNNFISQFANNHYFKPISSDRFDEYGSPEGFELHSDYSGIVGTLDISDEFYLTLEIQNLVSLVVGNSVEKLRKYTKYYSSLEEFLRTSEIRVSF